MEDKIIVTMGAPGAWVRFPCVVCGDATDKEMAVAKLPGDEDMCVCAQCLRKGNIDKRLRAHIKRLRDDIEFLESLVGRLVVPSYAEYQAANEEAERRFCIEDVKDELAHGRTEKQIVKEWDHEAGLKAADIIAAAKRELAAAK
jgi:hypothetical protein